ncbi:MAG: gamma-glutamyltransferase, partial [Gammaproteobacteria bacterium]|nr:gamma-glutamyltransferase [Gammaproteobacteria bacterium]
MGLTLCWALIIAAPGQAREAILEGDRFVPVEAKNGMVVTSHYLATDEALKVLEQGGNAVDAAVTTAFALA